MDFENEVCALSYSQKLKELGVKQKSWFFWISGGLPEKWWIQYEDKFNKSYHPENVCAFTATELITELPNRITVPYDEPFNNFRLFIRKQLMVEEPDKVFSVYCINYDCDTFDLKDSSPWLTRKLFPHSIYDKNFANALAKTKIYLIENKLI